MKNPQISLCLISHNEEAHIGRCLDSFKDIADEIIIVMALGSAKPDKSQEIAEKFGAKVFHYLNKPENKEWETCDNFGAARQMSFDMASGKFKIWCDMDDILPPGMDQKIRNLAEKDEHDVFHWVYRVPGDQSQREPMRERMFRTSIGGHWVLPLHENYQTPPHAKVALISDIFYIHAPIKKTVNSTDRNLRILNQSLNNACIYQYYIHAEHYHTGQKEKAIEAGKMALNYKNLPLIERYEVMLNLSLLSESDAEKEQYLMNAVRLAPWRREAFAYLTKYHISKKNYLKAQSYCFMMSCFNPQEIRPWTFQPKWYGNAGERLLAQCYRLVNQNEAAEEVEEEEFEKGKKVFSLLHPTRGRPEECIKMMEKWLDMAGKPEAVEHIFAVDSDDLETMEATKGFKRLVISDRMGCNAAYNDLAAMSQGKILISCADDINPFYHWDADVYEKLESYLDKEAILKVHDGYRNDDLLTVTIMTRARFEKQGFFHCGEYPTVFADNELTLRGQIDGVIVNGNDLTFKHEHPANNPNVKVDETYAKQNSQEAYRQGEEIFRRRNLHLLTSVQSSNGHSNIPVPA